MEVLIMRKIITKATLKAMQAKELLKSTKGENFVDSGIKILIAVVIGALLLGGLYALFGDVILPTLNQKVTDMEIKGRTAEKSLPFVPFITLGYLLLKIFF